MLEGHQVHLNRNKTIQLNEERCKEIERENKILLDKMHSVHTRDMAYDRSPSPHKKNGVNASPLRDPLKLIQEAQRNRKRRHHQELHE